MQTLLKDKVLVLIPETDAEQTELAIWKKIHQDHVLLVQVNKGSGLTLKDLGSKEDACNEPFQVISNSSNPAARLISNFAATPFILDDRNYTSVESFWQGLKFTDELERQRVALLDGRHARAEGNKQGYGRYIIYQRQEIPVGTWQHWQLMERACWAKFTQNEDAKEALLSTGSRPLRHCTRRDSRTIPGVIMAQIWTRIRNKLQDN
ncbi:MAG: NADAR family protein [Waterburya sp.]